MTENKRFHKILLMGRPGVANVPETLIALQEYLLSIDKELLVEKSASSMMGKHKLPVVDSNRIPDDCDLIIVVGGDGSLLNAAHIALPYNLPVLGINRGRLGFLTDIHPDELHKISNILDGDYKSEERFLLQAELRLKNKVIHDDIALNDVVLLPGDLAHMITFEIHIDERFVCNQSADGLIVASPTGSTAYALSGGGPILHPQLDAIVLVSMFPHTLSTRPIVVSGDSHIEVVVFPSNETSPYVSFDGKTRVSLPPGGRIHIKKKAEPLQLIHPKDYSYYATLREKLGWEKHFTRS